MASEYTRKSCDNAGGGGGGDGGEQKCEKGLI
ncbi:hypothetical protein DERF_004546 [Dermatophagoides farinae]|uniref:Uncharacterized protein n=1 Tax=Dermatophagoides farinae TaxID=6954 RepID=A0A922I3H5_DERFA|nr:hypothetical protein DERF_004546 [Dermatophagoides farinae]